MLMPASARFHLAYHTHSHNRDVCELKTPAQTGKGLEVKAPNAVFPPVTSYRCSIFIIVRKGGADPRPSYVFCVKNLLHIWSHSFLQYADELHRHLPVQFRHWISKKIKNVALWHEQVWIPLHFMMKPISLTALSSSLRCKEVTLDSKAAVLFSLILALD